MKHIRNLWSILKQEISLWKNEKKDLITGILYIGMITWLFYNRIVCYDLLKSISVFMDEAAENKARI